MAVRLVTGRAGSGKTSRILARIVESLKAEPLREPILWILPRQATFLAERMLACATGGFCRARVLSFELLGDELLKECGGSAVPRLTGLGRQMILGHLLRQHAPSLKFFSQVARHPGLAAKLAGMFGEFERCGRDPAELGRIVRDLAEADSLGPKLHDVQLIYKAYIGYVGQDWLDQRRWTEQVLQCVGRSRIVRDATIYVDGFYDFDDIERRMLVAMARVAQEMEIALLLDGPADTRQPPAEMSLFHRVEETSRRLLRQFREEGVAVGPPVVLAQARRFADAALAAVESRMFAPGGEALHAETSSIELTEAPDRRAEVEYVCRRIRALLGEGLKMRDIAVLVRRLEPYHDLITAGFAEHDIAFFVDRRRSMSHHPLVQFVRAVLKIAQENWPHETVMDLVKTGLAGLNADEADRLENYVLEHRVRGAAWTQTEPWAWRRQLTRGPADDDPAAAEQDTSAQMDALRTRIVAGMGDLAAVAQGPTTLRSIVTGLFDLLGRFAVPATLAASIAVARAAGRHEQAEEHEQVWGQLADLFDQMVDLLGREMINLADFQDVLETGLATFDLALTPPTVDQVLVGEIDRTVTSDAKAVFLLGLNQGLFPYAPRDSSILSDEERDELGRHSFEVDAGPRRRLLDEQFWGYVAFTRASHRLCVSRSLSDEAGRELEPSPFWRRLTQLFPRIEVRQLQRDELRDPAMVGTPRQLLTSLMRWARTAPREADAVWPALYDRLVRGGLSSSLKMFPRVWPALSYENSTDLSGEIAGATFPAPLRASVTQMEVFAACPFQHFMRYALNLEDRSEDDFVPIDLGNAFHDILERIVREMLQRRSDWASLPAEKADQLVKAYAFEVAQSLRGEMMLSVGRNRYVLARIQQSLDQVIAHQQAAAERGEFRTAFGRVIFGENGKLPPLSITTPAGRELLLHGRIDRIDLLERQAACAVLDYRLGHDKLDLCRVHHGLSLQLLAYLLVVRQHGRQLAGMDLAPAGAFYVRLLRQLEDVDHPALAPEPTDPAFALRGKPRGVFDTRYFRDFDKHAGAKESEVVAAYVKTDGTFGRRNATDVAEGNELSALLDSAQRQLGALAEQILAGHVEIRPYRLGTTSACANCRYRSICRFDPAINRYRHVRKLTREEVLADALKGVQHAG